ncbi:MAG: 1-acyl-sn-glycerol-3-phosphate acyltransferase [Paludibacteraceae bacterium]|nr:1-acyl-sn-glycerol-3-phosphate acyltransferase [Paludibacteraceae bacterium]
MPEDKTPVLVVGNHQNALGDPLALEFGFSDRRLSIFARADIFNNKFLNFFFRAIYVLPSYRMRTDGQDAVQKNFGVFNEAAQRLIDGSTLAIFPEGTNQSGHWLGEFSLAYLRLAFDAAALSDWQKDVKILPVGIHYASYFRFHTDALLNFGQPISLKPYYELYQTKPRTVQRKVDELVTAQLKTLMLHIENESEREAIEVIREGVGRGVLERRYGGKMNLPDALAADKQMVAMLEQMIQDEPELWESVRDEALDIEREIASYGVRHWVFYRSWGVFRIVMSALLLLVSAPVALVGLLLTGPIIIGIQPLISKFRNMGGPFPLFQSGIQIIALLLLPLVFAVVAVVAGCCTTWYWGLMVFVLCFVCGMGAWQWSVVFKKCHAACRYRRMMRDEEGFAVAERWRLLYHTLKQRL